MSVAIRKVKGLRCSRPGSIVFCLCLITAGAVAVDAQSDDAGSFSETFTWTSDDRSKAHPIELQELSEQDLGWDARLEIKEGVDLDMGIFPARDGDPLEIQDSERALELLGGRRELCSSNGTGRIERCQFEGKSLRERDAQKRAWLYVYAYGRGETDYSFSVKALRGPRLLGTDLYASDARSTGTLAAGSLELRGRFGDRDSRGLGEIDRSTDHLYEIEVSQETPDEVFISLRGERSSAPLRLSVYDGWGELYRKLEEPAQIHSLIIEPRKSERLFLLVSVPEPSDFARRDGYTITAEAVGDRFNPQIAARDAMRLKFGPRDRLSQLLPVFREDSFLVRLNRGQMALVTLEGRDYELEVFSGEKGFSESEKAYETTAGTKFLPLGSPYFETETVLTTLDEDQDFLIRVSGGSGFQGAKVQITEGRALKLPFLLRFDTANAVDVDHRSNRSIGGRLPQKGGRVYRLDLKEDERYVRARAEAVSSGPWDVDLAVCSAKGEVLAIGTGEVDAVLDDAFGERSSVFLVAFSTSAKAAGTDFELFVDTRQRPRAR